MADATDLPIPLERFAFPGWPLLGAYDSDVGSWLLHHGGEAMLLEVPEGLTVRDVRRAVAAAGVALRYVTASHSHEDHLDESVWRGLSDAFPHARFIRPGGAADRRLALGAEPLWLVGAPKHSPDDVVTVFRGVAMTGDIELGTLDSVNDEVPAATRRRSMRRLRDFPGRCNYHVHTVMSAHLNDLREKVDWRALFDV